MGKLKENDVVMFLKAFPSFNIEFGDLGIVEEKWFSFYRGRDCYSINYGGIFVGIFETNRDFLKIGEL